jgi:uncharacterized protein (TIGR03086 family)
VAPPGRGAELLSSAIDYALAGAGLGTAEFLARPTPCPEWDLGTLLGHLGDSVEAFTAAIGGSVDGAGPAGDPAGRLRGSAGGLLMAVRACGQRVVIGGRQLTANIVVATAAIEITVHGWDIGVACGAHRPVPVGLATVLLPIAPLLVTPGSRPGLFADPVRLPGSAGPGDQLVAFLGRRP